jgi:hypothetical protein
MILRSLYILLASCLVSQALPIQLIGKGRPRTATAAGPSYLVSEDCEGTGTPSGWTDTGTPIDWDFSDGTQWLRINDDTARSQSPTFAATTDFWGYVKFKVVSADFNAICLFLEGPDIEIQLFEDNTMRVSGSVNSFPTVALVPNNTEIEIWVHYVAGSGANASCSVAFSTDGSKPTSGDNFTQFTTGSETTGVTNFECRNEGGGVQDFRFDKIRADDANIGTSPP